MNRRVLAAAAFLSAGLLVQTAYATTKAAYMHYLRALLLQHQGDYAGALKEYGAAANLDPQSTYILEQAAELALETGQSGQALEMAQHLSQLDAKNPKVRLLLGNIHWARGDLKSAQESFEAALKIDPKYSEAMFALGNLLNAQSPDKAKKYFEDYLSANPERGAEAHFQIALVDERLGKTEEAIGHLKQASSLEPDFLQARYTLAHLYEVKHDTDAALGIYAALLDREPDNVTLLNHVGEIHYLKQELDAAETYFARSKAINPKNPGACLWLAILAEQRSDFGRAAGYLADSSALSEESELPLRLSYYLTQASRLKEAVAVLETAHAKWPENNEIAYFLALGYDDLKQSERGVALLQEILKRTPTARDPRFQLATLLERLNRVDEMEAEFKLLLKEHPNDASALNYLGYSLTDRGLKLQEAEGYIRKAVELDPANGAYLDSLGWSYFKQGNVPEAMKHLDQALKHSPEDPAVLEHFGDAQNAQGNALTAWSTWRTALSHDPSIERLQKKVAELESRMTAEELGARLSEQFKKLHGGAERVGSVAEITGTIADRTFTFNGLLTYVAPGRLKLELLGPLFVPIFRAELSPDGSFYMDKLPLEGLNPDAVHEAILESMRSLCDFFSGRVFDERPAAYHKGWRTRWIAAPSRQLFVDDANLRLQGVKSTGAFALRLSLDDYHADHGRHLPWFLKIEGKGFSISLRLSSPTVRYPAPPAGGHP
ncbi:MAG: tetratricopeptide repeat protein [Elusimicrobia bacterium]|nr:tetratricopeptide repeat protein [Elusimicrobiota bacterium]